MQEYTPPTLNSDAFNCPFCNAYAHQTWNQVRTNPEGALLKRFASARCKKCSQYSIWFDAAMIFPNISNAPLPVADMPEDVKEDFVEARNIVNQSPRGAAALLRLAIQKLMPHLGEKGKDLNTDIGNLVKQGLRETIQQALDSVRVIGNNAVHPGQIDLKDNVDIALKLFKLINIIVDEMITRPKEIAAIYNGLPQSSLDQIERRDGTI